MQTVSTRLPLDVKHLDTKSLDIDQLSLYSFDIKIFELKRLDGKGEQGMGRMALTELELAAARRREVVTEDRMDVRRARRKMERSDGRREHGWLSGALASAVARSPLARS